MVRLDPESVARRAAWTPRRILRAHGAEPVERAVHGGRPTASPWCRWVGRRSFPVATAGGRARWPTRRTSCGSMQTYDVLAVTSPAVEPDDIPINVRHLVSGLATLTLSDKSPFVYARGRSTGAATTSTSSRSATGSRPTRSSPSRRRGVGRTSTPTRHASSTCPWRWASSTSPDAGQPCIMTPFTLAGAMAPVTLAGALVLQHMEAVAAITLAQLTNPGAPVMYGAFTSNVDMKSGIARIRYPRGDQGCARQRPAGPSHRRAVAVVGIERLHVGRCPGWLRDDDEHLRCAARRGQLDPACRRLAGEWVWPRASRSSSSTSRCAR